MAVPASFDESNFILSRPSCMTADECEPLSVLCTATPEGYPVVFSLWKLTAEELAEINRTGRVWLGILGETMPPAFIAGLKPFTVEG